MGKQSARMYYDGKDHRDIYFKGNYHRAMYKGGQLVWKKITEGKRIPYIFKEEDNLVLRVLYIDGRTTVTVGNSKKFVSYRDRLVRGKNMVGLVVTNGQIVYSIDGENFKAIEGTSGREENEGMEGYHYSSQIDNFFWFYKEITKYGDRFYLVDTDTETKVTKKILEWTIKDGNNIEIISGVINPDLNTALFIRHSHMEGQSPSYTRSPCSYNRETGEIVYYSYSGAPYYDIPAIILGSDGEYIYTYTTRYNSSIKKEKTYVTKYKIGEKNFVYSKDVEESEIPYRHIKSSLYKNGKYIVYCSVFRKLEIYTTNDFLEFTKISTNRSITIHDVSSGKNIVLSFDSEVSGDWYMQPYCNLDNTYYFDENGDMHDDTGCLFCATEENVEAGIVPRRAMFYFDNFYFRESEGNFCEISD